MFLGVAAGRASTMMGRGAGATLPGTIALRIQPGLLGALAAAREVAVVSATNGKTTTTRMLSAALAGTGGGVLSNTDGSNLERGVLAALMKDRRRRCRTVALEVDELALPAVAAQVHPDLFVLGNLSRDQLDRMTECKVIVRRWQQMFADVAAVAQGDGRQVRVVANADDPLVTAAVLGPLNSDVPAGLDVTWVSVGQPWTGDAAACPRCSTPWRFDAASYSCLSCGFCRPDPSWELQGSTVVGPGGLALALKLGLPGRTNRANAVLAIAASALRGIEPGTALRAISELKNVDGRYATVQQADGVVRLLLAKNPAGWQEMLTQHAEERRDGPGRPIVLALNARTADGRDTSWIWDVPFEVLAGTPVMVSGERAEDLAVRLCYAQVSFSQVREPLAAVSAVRSHPGQAVDVLATYTAFTAVQRALGMKP